jgi:FPC/CPF motif-containing protein YcgG
MYMFDTETQRIIQKFHDFVADHSFPCIAAKAALGKQHISCHVVDDMRCPKDDQRILQFVYDFVDEYRRSGEMYHSAAVIFKGPHSTDEGLFETFLWQRLQALSDLDALEYDYDNRVDMRTSAAEFSFSLKQEAFFIIGLHAQSSRIARRFQYPTLVFNPHEQFEKLRSTARYERMKDVVRKRDVALEGSVNPMLKDYGEASEAYQYSGRTYDESWQCPLQINHGKTQHHSPS